MSRNQTSGEPSQHVDLSLRIEMPQNYRTRIETPFVITRPHPHPCDLYSPPLNISPGADTFAAAQHQWLHMPPDENSAWVPEALDFLFGEWSTHMDTHLQQWISKHNTAEMHKTMDQLVQSPMGSAKKRFGFSPRGM